MKKGWRKIACLAIATLAMVFAFATCTINTDSPETNTEQGGEATHVWDNGKITKAATENDDGEKVFTCTKCGETRTEAIPALNHEHTIASEWTSDDYFHWHEASCGLYEHRTDETRHTWNTGEVTTEPTCTARGKITYTCTVCGRTRIESSIAAKGHSYSTTWENNANGHWNKCIDCGSNGNSARHTIITASLTSDGERSGICTICSYKNTSAWTKDTLSELSAALDDYVETNEKAKIKISGKLSDANITEILNILKSFCERYDSSKQIDLDLRLTTDLTTIENSAFSECTSLASVMLPNGLTTIERSAFSGCTSLESITLPNGLTAIGIGAFYGCTSLASVTLPNGLTAIGNGVFSGCTSLASVTIPDDLTTIGGYMFYGCTSLTSVTIPKSVTEIGGYAFQKCEKLEKVEGMEGVTIIGQYAFQGCKSLKTIRIPPSVTEISMCAFDGAGLKTIELCEGLEKIGEYAFRSCSFTKIEIPSTVNFIGCSAFNNCGWTLTSIKFKDPSGWKYKQAGYVGYPTYDIDVSNESIVKKLTGSELEFYELLKE